MIKNGINVDSYITELSPARITNPKDKQNRKNAEKTTNTKVAKILELKNEQKEKLTKLTSVTDYRLASKSSSR